MRKLFSPIPFLLAMFFSSVLFAQKQDDGKYAKATVTGIGLYPGIEAANTPGTQSSAVFSPDITYSFGDNQIGAGPRIILNNTDQFSNAPKNTATNWGVGVNYRKFLTNSHTMFDWFVYYDAEYFNYKSVANPADIFSIYNNAENQKADHYNFITGFGYHLHMVQHFYMSAMLGLGIALEYGKKDFYNIDQNGVSVFVNSDTYSTKEITAQFKLGVGYVF